MTTTIQSAAISADGDRFFKASPAGRIYTSPSPSTTPGAAGGLDGGDEEAVGLQYAGNGLFHILYFAGSPLPF